MDEENHIDDADGVSVLQNPVVAISLGACLGGLVAAVVAIVLFAVAVLTGGREGLLLFLMLLACLAFIMLKERRFARMPLVGVRTAVWALRFSVLGSLVGFLVEPGLGLAVGLLASGILGGIGGSVSGWFEMKRLLRQASRD